MKTSTSTFSPYWAAVDSSPEARRAVEGFAALGRRIDEVSHAYITAVDAHDLDRDDLDVSVAAGGFASLNHGGRYRVELDARLKREIVRDFYATLRGYESYDSRPATEGAPLHDYGITFALGWSF